MPTMEIAPVEEANVFTNRPLRNFSIVDWNLPPLFDIYPEGIPTEEYEPVEVAVKIVREPKKESTITVEIVGEPEKDDPMPVSSSMENYHDFEWRYLHVLHEFWDKMDPHLEDRQRFVSKLIYEFNRSCVAEGTIYSLKSADFKFE